MGFKSKTSKILTSVGAFFGLALVLVVFWSDPREREAQRYLEQTGIHFPNLKSEISKFLLDDPQLNSRDVELAQLGRKLFFTTGLSRDQNIACATCHRPERSFTDGLALAQGIRQVNRNTPTIINSFSSFWFFWDGRADSLAAQALGPLENDDEHGITRAHVARYIVKNHLQEYEKLFGKVNREWMLALPDSAKPAKQPSMVSHAVIDFATSSLGDPKLIRELSNQATVEGTSVREVFRKRFLGEDQKLESAEIAYGKLDIKVRSQLDEIMANVGVAIEAFEKGIVANQSPFDKFAKRWSDTAVIDPTELFDPHFTAQELLGFSVFVGKGKCNVCHTGGHFSDNQFHNIGLPNNGDLISLGRSVGIRKTLSDEFNCLRIFAKNAERQTSESCKDLKYLDPDTPEGIGSFKTPTLRNVSETGPYMHDGRMARLRSVLDHYNVMDSTAAVGFREETLKPLGLSDLELQSLELFLKALNSPVRDLTEVETVH